jgi:DNA-binding CsgD family transcriptional regulator
MVDRRLELVEAAYDLATPQPAWLSSLSGSMRESIDCAASCFAFEVRRHGEHFTVGELGAEDPRVAEQIRRSFAELPPAVTQLFFSEPLRAMPSREVLAEHGVNLDDTPLASAYAEVGFADVFSMAACDPRGAGVVIGVGLREREYPPQPDRLLWSQVAAHIAAGVRLRRRLEGQPAVDRAAAVLRTDGKLEHVDTGVDPGLGELLREAVRRVELARSRKRDTHEALALWQALIAGEWSLADHFEGSGRRYYVAVRNAPEVARSKALTRREAEVVSYLACGTETTATAYALGLDVVTVRGYLRTAMAKLGVRSRAQLISLRAMLVAQGRLEPGDP